MDINYLILAHKNPHQLPRLIERLSSPDTSFIVHVDKKVPLHSFQNETRFLDNIYYIDEQERIKVAWGDISIVEATMTMINKVLTFERTGYVILLSGQDYPIKSNHFIRNFLKNNYGQNFLTSDKIPTNLLTDGGVDRIEEYNFHPFKEQEKRVHFPSIYDKNFYTIKTLKNLALLLMTKERKSISLIFKKRRFPHYLTPYAGDQWWALPIETIRFIKAFLEEHPSYLTYHRLTNIPDEIFFNSIVYTRCPKETLKDSLTYTNWEKNLNSPHPLVFHLRDFHELLNKPHAFARKFDETIDKNILDKIDRDLLSN